MKHATLVTDLQATGEPDPTRTVGIPSQKLWRLSAPLAGYGEEGPFEHVVTSSNTILGRPETYIFGSDAEGAILDWGELPGSFKGALDHEQALTNAGYEVTS